MRSWFRGKGTGLVAFLLIATLVAGGLGWATAAALRLEQEQLASRAEAELYGKLRLALWRLDSLVSPALARENSRPYNHYSAVFAPSLALSNDGNPWAPGTVLEPSPLLNEELPEWMLLHFQAAEAGWASPQVISPTLADNLNNTKVQTPVGNVQPDRAAYLAELSSRLRPEALRVLVQDRGTRMILTDSTLLPANKSAETNYSANAVTLQQQPQQQAIDPEYQSRLMQRAQVNQAKQASPQRDDLTVALGNTEANGANWFVQNPKKASRSQSVPVTLGPMIPLWLTLGEHEERLLLARLVQVGQLEVCQGILLDWPRIRTVLAEEVRDLFPEAQMKPVREEEPPHPERTMTALPVQLDPGPGALAVPALGWTPLRVGLGCAWLAALLALAAVGLGGWSLLDLSERRIRFVSAVTHELRTPLTTLRLYLDMLAGGMVKEERQKAEYLQTLNTEAERLNRLVGNVLDFSRLENQRPRLAKVRVTPGDILGQVQSAWQRHCHDAAKELVLDNQTSGAAALFTDVQLVQQILGNLIDNACKYSREATDPRIWLRARRGSSGAVQFDVEDRGPGVPARERRSIFRPFRRGRGADVTAGGVGLGLALAQRWAHLVGGKLTLRPGDDGACFRLELAS